MSDGPDLIRRLRRRGLWRWPWDETPRRSSRRPWDEAPVDPREAWDETPPDPREPWDETR